MINVGLGLKLPAELRFRLCSVSFCKVVLFLLQNVFSVVSGGKNKSVNAGAYCCEIVTGEIILLPLRFCNCILG